MNAAHFPMVHHIRPLASGFAALALLLAACGGSHYRFVGDGDALTYKVPKDWVEFGRDQVLRAIGLQDAQTAQAFRYLTAYDAAEEPSLQHVLRSVPEEPTLIAYV